MRPFMACQVLESDAGIATHPSGGHLFSSPLSRARQHVVAGRNFAAHPGYFALPHPSWRTIGWERRNPWFGETVLPALQTAVAGLIA